jgi:hypothetical protein
VEHARVRLAVPIRASKTCPSYGLPLHRPPTSPQSPDVGLLFQKTKLGGTSRLRERHVTSSICSVKVVQKVLPTTPNHTATAAVAAAATAAAAAATVVVTRGVVGGSTEDFQWKTNLGRFCCCFCLGSSKQGLHMKGAFLGVNTLCSSFRHPLRTAYLTHTTLRFRSISGSIPERLQQKSSGCRSGYACCTLVAQLFNSYFRRAIGQFQRNSPCTICCCAESTSN